jgi:protein phosphatase
MVVAGVTDVGRQRKHNEDCVLLKPALGVFVVADGMGGHNAGDVASKLVTTSLGNYFEATAQGAPTGELPDEYASLAPEAKRLAAGVRKANHDVFVISNTHQQHHGMGSTVVAIHIADGHAHIAHVGDSRCYRIRDGEIQQLTRDHSLINDALDMKPDLTKEELARLPKNIITRALGMKDAVKVDIRSEPTQPGDMFLLCSDGLTGMVPPDQILEVVGLAEEPQEACELLIAEANDAGGTDNISAVLVRIDAAIDETEPAAEVVIDRAVAVDAAPRGAASADMDWDADPEAADEVYTAAAVDTEAVTDPAPEVEVGPNSMPVVESEVESLPDDVAEALAAGGEVDLDVQGPWPNKPEVPRCRSCNFELFPGNSFCVECGTRIEAEDQDGDSA